MENNSNFSNENINEETKNLEVLSNDNSNIINETNVDEGIVNNSSTTENEEESTGITQEVDLVNPDSENITDENHVTINDNSSTTEIAQEVDLVEKKSDDISIINTNLNKTFERQPAELEDENDNEVNRIVNELFDKVMEQFSEIILIDNELITNIIKYLIEQIEKYVDIKGKLKEYFVKEVLKKYLENKGVNVDEWLKLISKLLPIIISISKKKDAKVEINTKNINTTKEIFNSVYSLTCKKIEESYPLTDDLINSTLDILHYSVKCLDNFKNIDGTTKRLIIKNIAVKIIEELPKFYNGITEEEITRIKNIMDSSLALIEIAIKAKNGKLEVNVEEVLNIWQQLKKCLTNSCK